MITTVFADISMSSAQDAATSHLRRYFLCVTLGSAALAFVTVEPVGWGWNALYAEILVLGGLAFAVLSNSVFLVASIRYARAIHPRLHFGGFFLGIAASIALLFLYVRILP